MPPGSRLPGGPASAARTGIVTGKPGFQRGAGAGIRRTGARWLSAQRAVKQACCPALFKIKRMGLYAGFIEALEEVCCCLMKADGWTVSCCTTSPGTGTVYYRKVHHTFTTYDALLTNLAVYSHNNASIMC